MDFTRFSLYTALAVITYLMLLAWQEDYPPVVESEQASQSATIPSGNGDIPGSDLPTAPVSQDAPASDLPVATPQTATTAPQTSSTANSDSIEVSTDTLQLRIDLLGGDISYLALPQYLRELEGSGDPFVMLNNNPGRSYVAQSGLIGRDGVDSPQRASYQSSADSYELSDNADSLQVDLVTQSTDGVTITKRFTFTRGSYLIDISYLVDNAGASDWQGNVFGQIKRDEFDDPSDAGGFGRTYLGFVTTSNDDPYIKIEFDDINDGVPNHEMEGGWMGFSQHYFISAWVPSTDTVNRFSTRRNNANQYFGVFTSSAFSVPAGESGSQTIQYYAGPKDQYALAEIAPNLDLTIDYGFLWFLAAPIYWVLRQIEDFVGNYGFSIILLTVLVKAAFYKLSETQYRSMAGMRRLMPKMQQLKESYGDDKMKLQKATMDLYKKEKINPFGGCLPMLVQMPVFIALYWVLMESVELRHAPFMLWLNDLSVRDPYFILPLLMGVTMYLQTSLSPTPADPMQAKVMKFMPIAMTVLFLWFPAGLVLYWLTNGLLGIAQQWYITRKLDAEHAAKGAK
ncbi:MAG: membrane protein insertase YidC [Pseudomonadales bacterium]|nr:membrane protein insertase YidC [Pseudomonadales bacterium]